MIIGIDASRANLKHKTGTEWYSYYLIKYFARLDSENQYILYTNQPLRGGLADLTRQEVGDDSEGAAPCFDKKGYQIIKSPHNNFRAAYLRWPFIHLWTLGRLSLEMIWNKPDVLFVPAHVLPLIMPRHSVNTIHDLAFKKEKNVYEKGDMGSTNFKKKVLHILARLATSGKYCANSSDYLDWSSKWAVKKAEKIITVSEFTRCELEDFYNCQKEKIKVVYNGYNNEFYRRVEDERKIEEVLNKYGIKKPYLLYVGRLEKKKNTPRLIEAFAKALHFNKNIEEKLVLIGNASFGYDEVKYTISEFGLDKRVIMPGWVEEGDMPAIFSAATAFILPSLYEGFGIPILQAFACGTPAMVSDIPAMREIAGSAALFFNPSHKESIARAIERITKDNVLREELARKGLERAKNFSWEKCAKETLSIITKI